jgi:hypothetical protein
MKSERCWGLVNVETRHSDAVVEYAIPNGYQKPGNICQVLISSHTTQNLPSHYPSPPSHTYMNHPFAVSTNIIFKGVPPRVIVLLNTQQAKSLAIPHVESAFNPLTPELNPSAQCCLARIFTGDFAS